MGEIEVEGVDDSTLMVGDGELRNEINRNISLLKVFRVVGVNDRLIFASCLKVKRIENLC